MNQPYSRIESIDVLRGLVLILMLLDHTRAFFSNVADPMSLSDPNTMAYFTRWITHYCAPVFIFLAGISAYLSAQRSSAPISKTSYFLLTRGIWFVILECTVMFAVWSYFLVPYQPTLQVFAAIGFSMIFLSLLVFFPLWLIGTISILLIAGHNILDFVSSTSFGEQAWFWILLHEGGHINGLEWFNIKVRYPLIPWLGVMGLGYFMGNLFTLPEKPRRQYLFGIGFAFILAFIILRFINVYGDPNAWHLQDSGLLTLMSFLNTQKYPPSLSYVLMTLGPALLFLGLITEKNCKNKINQMMLVFGKVPFFFYVTHVVLVVGCAIAAVFFVAGLEAALDIHSARKQYGYSINVVYGLTFSFLFLLYYPCVWYGKLKGNHKKWYFSYL
jgi:uncharacterized membrane protein